MTHAKISLEHQLLRLQYALNTSVSKTKVRVDELSGSTYNHRQTAEDDYYLAQAVAIIDLDLFDNLSAHATKFLLRLIKEMKMNNVFWKDNPDTSTANDRRSIAELKKAEILLSTEYRYLYIINPFKIRRGKPLSIINASLAHFYVDRGVMSIEDLRPPKTQNTPNVMMEMQEDYTRVISLD